MNVFKDISTTRFTLNGVEYLKNYISTVRRDKVIVFNNYERKDVLVDLTSYTNFTVNGASYGSAAALQAALLSVIYNRTTLGGSNIELTQDNIDIAAYADFLQETVSALDVVNRINTSPNIISLNNQESLWIIARAYSISSSGNVSLNSIYPFKVLNNGKGVYGSGQKQLKPDDLLGFTPKQVNITDIESDPKTLTVNFGNIGTTVSQWLNSRNPAVSIQPQDDGYTILKGTINGEVETYLFVGLAGRYGVGNLQSVDADFQLLNEASKPYIPGFNDVLAKNNEALIPINMMNGSPVLFQKPGGGPQGGIYYSGNNLQVFLNGGNGAIALNSHSFFYNDGTFFLGGGPNSLSFDGSAIFMGKGKTSTPIADENSQVIPTTEWVQKKIKATAHRPVKKITTATAGFANGVYTLLPIDRDYWLSFDIATAFQITVPVFTKDTLIEGDVVGNGQATFVPVSGLTLIYPASELPKIAEKNSVFGLKYRTEVDVTLYGRLALL